MQAEAASVGTGSTLHSTAWELAAQITVLACGLLIMGALARGLGPAGYGQYAVLITVLCWVEYGLAGFFSRATIKAIAEADEWQPVARTALRGGLVLSVVFAVGFVVVAWPIAWMLGMPELAWLVALVAIDIPIFLRSQIYLQILAGLRSFGHRAMILAARAMVRCILVLAVVALGGGVPLAALTWVGASIVELLIARSLSGLHVHGPRVPTRALATASIPLFVAAVSLKLTEGMDLFIVKALSEPDVAGWYAGAVNLALVPAFLGMALMPVILSTVSERRKREGREAACKAGAAWLRVGFLALPLAAVGIALAPEISRLVLGEGFVRSAEFLPVLLVACAGRVWVALATAFLAGIDLAREAARLAVGYLVASPIGVIVGVMIGGPIGAATGYAMVAWLGVGGILVLLMVTRSARIPWSCALRAAIAVACILALGTAWPTVYHPFAVVAKAAALAVIMLGVVALLGEWTRSDWRHVRSLIMPSGAGMNANGTTRVGVME